MRRMVLHMLTTGSLSAFSSANLTVPGGLGGVAAAALGNARIAPAPRASEGAAQTAALPSDQPLPRGSLLNLSV